MVRSIGSKPPFLHQMFFEEGNMTNISPTIKINISNKPGIEENITLGAQCTLKEIEALHLFIQRVS